MTWKIEFHEKALKEFKKLSKPTQIQIRDYIRKELINCKYPKTFGKPLRNKLSGLWRYRVEKYRIIVSINNEIGSILVLKIAKRDKAYL